MLHFKLLESVRKLLNYPINKFNIFDNIKPLCIAAAHSLTSDILSQQQVKRQQQFSAQTQNCQSKNMYAIRIYVNLHVASFFPATDALRPSILCGSKEILRRQFDLFFLNQAKKPLLSMALTSGRLLLYRLLVL